jgi:nicotinamidase/pyrazinamidase
MRALILVDLQNDFMPGGALEVPEGDQVVEVANLLAARFSLVVATQDWHPRDHNSFAANHPGHEIGEVIELNGLSQVLWPVHCVQDSLGAELVRDLDRQLIHKIIRKGTERDIDSYSTFFDNGHRHATGLRDYLVERDVGHVYLMGLATDYCVKFSALDAVRLGFAATVIEDGCRGVELDEGDVAGAMREMRKAGVQFAFSSDVEEE